MNILFDTNVILDVLLDRKPFSDPAAYLLSKVENAEVSGFVCATTITTIHYLLTKYLTKEKAIENIHSIMSLFEIASVNRMVIENALKARFSDFEDSVLHESAKNAGVKYIVTRNIGDFKKATIPVYTPAEMLTIFESWDLS